MYNQIILYPSNFDEFRNRSKRRPRVDDGITFSRKSFWSTPWRLQWPIQIPYDGGYFQKADLLLARAEDDENEHKRQFPSLIEKYTQK